MAAGIGPASGSLDGEKDKQIPTMGAVGNSASTMRCRLASDQPLAAWMETNLMLAVAV